MRSFANLRMPASAVDQVLQGRPDPASHFVIPKRDDEDFGQTLATWGWRDSRYLVLPLRDAVGIVGDQPLSPIGHIQDSGTASGLQAMELVDMRTRMLPIDEFRRNALDDYVFVRDAWSQRRNSQIRQDLRSNRD